MNEHFSSHEQRAVYNIPSRRTVCYLLDVHAYCLTLKVRVRSSCPETRARGASRDALMENLLSGVRQACRRVVRGRKTYAQ